MVRTSNRKNTPYKNQELVELGIEVIFFVLLTSMLIWVSFWLNDATKTVRQARPRLYETKLPVDFSLRNVTKAMKQVQKHRFQNLFNQIIIINLDDAVERKQKLQLNLHAYFPDVPVYKLYAIREKNKNVGCTKSHLCALMYSKELPGNTLIIEDDFNFTLGVHRVHEYFQHFQDSDMFQRSEWDLLVMSPFVQKWKIAQSMKLRNDGVERKVMQLLHCTTTSAHIVRKDFVDNMISCFQRSLSEIVRYQEVRTEFCIDQVWNEIMSANRFMCFSQPLGYQLPGVTSDGTFADNSISISDNLQVLHTQKGDLPIELIQ